METNREALWAIARIHRDRAWDMQRSIVPGDADWEPENEEPRADVELFWYLQGKAEAYASIMSELESSR
jgi:hypothetical protein